ncbi:hypothetical protein ND861_19330, partial [Leptospira sp. 2 VSF19]
LIIGTVSVLISSISSIYSLLLNYLNRSNLKKESIEKISKLKKTIESTIQEIKENTLFIFFAFVINFLLIIFINVDLPYLSWPIQSIYFTKIKVFYSVSITSIFLSLFAIYDIILAIFTVHECQSKLLVS